MPVPSIIHIDLYGKRSLRTAPPFDEIEVEPIRDAIDAYRQAALQLPGKQRRVRETHDPQAYDDLRAAENDVAARIDEAEQAMRDHGDEWKAAVNVAIHRFQQRQHELRVEARQIEDALFRLDKVQQFVADGRPWRSGLTESYR